MPTISDSSDLQQTTESLKNFSQGASAALEALQSITNGLKNLDTEKLSSFSKSVKAVASATERLNTEKLTNLAKSLILVSAGLQRLETEKLANFAKSLRSLSTVSDQLDATKFTQFSEAITTVATSVGSALSKLNAEKFANFAKSIRSVTTALGRLDATKTEEFNSFAKSIRSVSAASERLNTDVLSNLPPVLRALATAAGRLNTDKTEKLANFAKAIRTAATALEKLDTTAVEKLSNLAKALTSVAPAMGTLTKASVEKLSEFSKGIKTVATALGKLTKSGVDRVSELAKGLTLIRAAFDRLDTTKFTDFAKAIRSIAIASNTLTKAGVDRLTGFSKAITTVSNALGKLNADKFIDFAKAIRMVSNSLEKLTTSNLDNLAGFAKRLGEITPVIGEAVNKLSKNKFASFSQGLAYISSAAKNLDQDSLNNLSNLARKLGSVVPAINDAVGRLRKNRFADFSKGLGTISTAAKRLDENNVNKLAAFAKKLSSITATIDKALAKLDVGGFASFSRSIRYVSDSLEKLDTNQIARLNNLSQALKAFTGKVNPAELQKAGDAMRNLFTGMGAGAGSGSGGSRGVLGVTHRGLGELTAAISPLTIGIMTATRVARNFIQTFRIFTEFEFTMQRVGGVTRTVGHEFQRLTDFAREMGATTIFTATDAAQSMETLGRLGFTAGEILSALPGVLNVAAGEGIRLADAARIVAVNLNAFELQASDTSRVTNVLAAASIRSAASMKDLGIGLRTVATFAHTAGISIEETVTMLSKLADAGLTPYRASVALRQLLLQMQVPARAGALEQLDKMSLRVADINPKVVGLTQAIATLKQRMNEFNVDANRVFTIRASQAFQILSQVGAKSLADFEQSITGTNTAARLAERQMDSLHGSYRKLVSVWQEMQIAIGTALVPMIRALTDAMAGALRMFASLSDGSQKLIVGIGTTVVSLTLLIQTFGLLRKLFNPLTAAFMGFATTMITTTGVMRARALALLTPWQMMIPLMKALKAQAITMAVSAAAALGPWGLAIAGIAAALGGLVYFIHRADKAAEEKARRERDRLQNEINLRGLVLQRLDEQAQYQHERTFLPDEQEQVKALAQEMGILNIQFNEAGQLIGKTAEEIDELSAAMRKAEAHSKILTKIEALRSRQGKVVFDLEERVALKAFADEIGGLTIKFNQLGEAIFESEQHQRNFMEAIAEFKRQGEITLTGEDIVDFQKQRADMLKELGRTAAGQLEKIGPGDHPLMAAARRDIKASELERELSAMLSAAELREFGTDKIEDFIKQFPVELRGQMTAIVNQIIGATEQIEKAQQKQRDLEGQKGVYNPFAPPPPPDEYVKGFLESMDEIAKRSEKQRLEAEALQLDQPLESHKRMLAAIEEEIQALQQLRKHRDAASYPEELWDIEMEIIRKRIEYNKQVAQQEEKTQQERVRQFEVDLQTMSRGARDWSIQRIEANRYMLRKMADQAREFEEFRPGTYNKWRKAIDDLTKAQADRLKQTAQDSAKMYRDELQKVTKSATTGDYQALLEQRNILTSIELEIQGTDAFDFASELREKLEDEVIEAFKTINKRLEAMFKEGLLDEIGIESANLQDISNIGLLQDRMERIREIGRSVFEDDLYNQFPDLQKDISEATASALRAMMDRMATLVRSQMMQDIEGGMDLSGILAKYEDVIAELGDSFDMTDVIQAAADKAKERAAQAEKSFAEATQRLDDQLASLTIQELEQKKVTFYQFAKIAQNFGMSVDEFVRTYQEIIKNIDDEIKRRTDLAKSDAAYQRLQGQDLVVPPAAAGIPATGQEGVTPTPTGPTAPEVSRTTIGQEMRGYRAPIFGFREQADLQKEALQEQLQAIRDEEQAYRDRLARQGDRRGAISRDPRILRFREQQRAIEDQIRLLDRQNEAYSRFREATENIANLMFDSFSSLSTWIKTEGGKILLSGLNVINQFDLGQYIEKLGVSFDTLTTFFNTLGTSFQQASSIVDFTGKIYERNANKFTKHLAGIGSALSGIPSALDQGLGLGGALASAAGGVAGFYLGGAPGAALGASITSSLYAEVSGRGQLEEEVDGSTNVSTARGSVNVRRQEITIGNINNEVNINTDTVDDQLVDQVADRLGDRLDANLTAVDGGL